MSLARWVGGQALPLPGCEGPALPESILLQFPSSPALPAQRLAPTSFSTVCPGTSLSP